MRKTDIKVFVTKGIKFRASITDRESKVGYEVTIGGEEWNRGKGSEHRRIIKKKCDSILAKLAEITIKNFHNESNT